MSMFIHGFYFMEVGFGTGGIKKYSMDLNLLTDSDGEPTAIGALKLTIDLLSIDFQKEAVNIGVKGGIRFCLVVMLIINNGVVIFTTSPNKGEEGNKTQ
ncbi:hypothetical protein C6500_13480 [Candidatus Poribacteria bacterium]|nr:MAG: hypothetical protein C6500_13480 [Candidatus Poribacteria bacterium]